jgi:FKBP-type peptidyl-prolyl cis-trans isomerase 2
VLITAIGLSAIGFVLLNGNDAFVPHVQAFPTLVQDSAVKNGATVTVRIQITPRDNPDESYDDTEQFIQGQHTVPEGIESQVAGMHSGEIKTFPLSAEEGFGPRDETKLQLIPTTELPPDVREGDTLADDAGRYAQIILILPELALIDLNHPLAGQPLLITLQVMTVEVPDERGNTESETDSLLRQILVWRPDLNNNWVKSVEART